MSYAPRTPASPYLLGKAEVVNPPPLHRFRVSLVEGMVEHEAPGWGLDPSGALIIMGGGVVKAAVAYAPGTWVRVEVVE